MLTFIVGLGCAVVALVVGFCLGVAVGQNQIVESLCEKHPDLANQIARRERLRRFTFIKPKLH